MHSDRMALDNGGAVINIDNQTGQAVAFGVNQAVAVGHFGLVKAQLLPEVKSPLNFLYPKGDICFNGFVRQQTHRNTACLVVPDGQESPPAVEDLHLIAINRFAFDTLDSP